MLQLGGAVSFPAWMNSKPYYLEPPIIACGVTARSRTSEDVHAVVAMGGKVVYDPHPSEAGLLVVTGGYLVIKI